MPASSASAFNQSRSSTAFYTTKTLSLVTLFGANMDSDEDVSMQEEAQVFWPTTNGKGKGKEKATEPPPDASHDPENLPW